MQRHGVRIGAEGQNELKAIETAERLGVEVEGVEVEADGSFDDEWRSTGFEYSVTLDSTAPAEVLERLGAVVDEVAEIPRAVRAGAPVRKRI